MAGLQYDNVLHPAPVRLEDAVEIRKVADTDLMDYDNLQVNDEAYQEYASPFPGEKEKRSSKTLEMSKLKVGD